MSVDLSQFHQVFFEESFEGLDAMEDALMELDPSAIDSETINTIFRSAHSIKGGSATFGFSVVADFTHVLETLLDEIRAGNRGMSQDDVDLFLQSVDCLRQLLTDLQQGVEPDTESATELRQAFEAILAGKPTTHEPSVQADSPVANHAEAASDTGSDVDASTDTSISTAWQVTFWPSHDILRTGNEPLRIFRDIAELGQLTVKTLTGRVPNFDGLDPEDCHLGFELLLLSQPDSSGAVKSDEHIKAAIKEAFEWVSDESDIDIKTVAHVHNGSEHNASPSHQADWTLTFIPNPELLQTGNEPLRIFREMAETLELKVEVLLDKLPSWKELQPETCYLGWTLHIHHDNDDEVNAVVQEAFEWVSDEATIDLKKTDLKTTDVRPETKEVELANTESSKVESNNTITADVSPTEPVSPAQANTEATTSTLPSTPKTTTSATPKPAAKAPAAKREAASIRVDIDKVDTLINMVGELVITQSMLGELGKDFDMSNLPKLLEGLGQLEQNTRELQESVMRIRMLPISVAFNRFPRLVRDLSRKLDKKIELKMIGEQTELDKTVMEKIGDPLVHLVRNALDHGIEMPADRVAAGKPETGTVTLNAYHQSGHVVIEIKDDGKGLDRDALLKKAIEKGLTTETDAAMLSDSEVYDMIFQPGFSTAKEVSDLSGRGVGMDVVRKNITALSGSVEIDSTKGKGSRITIRLPLTLAILDGQLVRIGDQTFIFPLVSIVESLERDESTVRKVAGGSRVFQLRNEYVPIIRLYELFNVEPSCKTLDDGLLVVVENDGEKVGVLVDELLAQQQVVIKSLEQNYQRVEGISGATILGDGTVALILDIPGLVKLAGIANGLNSHVANLAQSHARQQPHALH